MITVPIYVLVGQVTLLLVACYVLASAYRRIGAPAHEHDHTDEAATLAGTPLPDLGPVVGADGVAVPAPRSSGPGEPTVLLYVLPGCEGCLSALNNLQAVANAEPSVPPIHLLTVGEDTGLDNYARFGFPVWRATRDLTEVLGLTAYPVFLSVDHRGLIAAAGSVHHRDAIRSYLTAAAAGVEDPSRTVQAISITQKP